MKEILNASLPLRQVIIDRLEELDYTPESLREAITEHEADYRDENPSLYCGTYAKYNGGDLSGLWVDLSTFDSYEDFINFCQACHADENDPETGEARASTTSRTATAASARTKSSAYR